MPSSTTVLETLDHLWPPGTPVTTSEVTEEFDCSQRTIHNKLVALVDDGVLHMKQVGANSHVWWRPVEPEQERSEGSPKERVQVRSHHVFDSEMIGVIVWGEDVTIRDANDAFLEMAGLNYEEALGMSWQELTPEEFYPASERHISEVEESGSGVPYEKQYYHADGSRWWGLFESWRLNDSEIVEFVVEITERRVHEQELRRFRQAADAAGHAVYFTDPDGTIEYVNPAFESITGYSATEAIGRNPRILNSGEMSDGYYEDLWSALLNGNIWEEEVINRRKNGELYTAYQTIAPITTDDEIDGFVAVQTDITDRKGLEADLKTSLTQLEVLARVLRHNLRNDMNVITANAETIRATSEGDVAEMAEIITEKSEQLLTTVDKEHEITDVLVDEQSPDPIDLEAVIDATVATTREQYPEAHITVESAVDRQVLALESINRALPELLTNAVNHSDQTEPSIEVTVEDCGDTVAVRIADDGPGISEMERKILTEQAEIDSLYHGTGLGLWLVKIIVENSGGSLAFDENEPRGSIVTITLPIAPAD